MKFNDGDETELNENLISEAIYVQYDMDKDQYVLLDSIVDCRGLDMAIQSAEQTDDRHDGCTNMTGNTIGWQMCCQWKDGLTSWENLPDLK